MIDQNLLDSYRDLNWNQLLRKDLGEYSLEEAKPIFERIKNIFDLVINNSELNNFSQNAQSQIQNKLQDFMGFCNQIVNSFQNTSERNSWMDRVKQQESELINVIGNYFAYFSIIDPSKDRELKKYITEADEKVKELDEKLKSVDDLIEGAKRTAQKAEAQSFGDFFGDTSKENKERAQQAFWLMFLSVAVTAGASFLFLHNFEFDNKDGNFWGNFLETIYSQNLLLKIIFVSLGGFVIAHFSKVYSAEMHLYVLNIQRQNALNSHKQILNSVQATSSDNDLETQNAILLQVTKAIFDNQITGYLKDQSNPAMPSGQILEITKTLQK